MFQNLGRMLAAGSSLKIECEACRRLVTWPQDQALQRLGPDAAPFVSGAGWFAAYAAGRLGSGFEALVAPGWTPRATSTPSSRR
jgi:hypothetical protein